MATDSLLTTREASALLGIHAETLRDLARRDEIPHLKIGRHLRFSRAALLRELQEPPDDGLADRLTGRLAEAEGQAWRCLSGFDIQGFGRHAAVWVALNDLLPPEDRRPNPFAPLVRTARELGA